MEKKNSFYLNDNEQTLKRIVDSLYNEEVGSRENSFLDGDYDELYTGKNHTISVASLIEDIYSDIMSATKILHSNDWTCAIEPKHIHFIGAERVHAIVEHRINFRVSQDTWIFPHE